MLTDITWGGAFTGRTRGLNWTAATRSCSRRLYSGGDGADLREAAQALRLIRGLEAEMMWVSYFGCSVNDVLPTGPFSARASIRILGCETFEANLRHKSVLIDIGS
ncbi:hypothetical protein [Pseudomonas sp. P105]|uniref:hypothetical protein n=1 Tax=Pseudomonas sp. P105 TaxID=3049542 RepID=UPI002934491C|nr:hypothetical protein [Pseudomonas sp. P105]WNZ80969.1 hypothetical protein QOM08_13040 [Pseudomonas sp. P105]